MELLQAALDLFDEGGLSTCTVDAVAKRAGASKTTAYAYFPDGVGEMLRDMYRTIAERVRSRGEDLHKAAVTTEDRIVALAEALFDICGEPKVGRFYMMLSPTLSPLLEPVVGGTSAHFGKLIASELSRKLPTGVAVNAYSTLLVGAISGAANAVARDSNQRNALTHALRVSIRSILSAK